MKEIEINIKTEHWCSYIFLSENLQESHFSTLFCVPNWDEHLLDVKMKHLRYNIFLISNNEWNPSHQWENQVTTELVMPYLEFQFWSPQYKRGYNEVFQQRTMNVIQRLEHLSMGGSKSWYSSVRRRKGSGISSMLTNTWREDVQRIQTGSFQCVHCQEKMQWAWNETLESLSKNQEKYFALAHVAQSTCGASIYGDI